MTIQNLNEQLKPYKKKLQRYYLLSVVIAITYIIVFFNLVITGVEDGALFILIIGSGVLAYVVIKMIQPVKAEYQDVLKSLINSHVFQKEFENVKYYHDDGIPLELMRETAVIDLGIDYRSNDLMEGSYHGVDFVRADVLTKTETQAGKSRVTIIHFHGQVYVFDFHKNTQNYVRIRSKGPLFGGFTKGKKIDQSEKIEFEDSEFNDAFHIYTNNPQEAFYIFTPHYMERIKGFYKGLGQEISVVVKNGIMYLAIYSSRDAFELSSFRDLDEAYISDVTDDVRMIKFIIDDLGLDSDLFKE